MNIDCPFLPVVLWPASQVDGSQNVSFTDLIIPTQINDSVRMK